MVNFERIQAERREKRRLEKQKIPKIKCLWCGELFIPNSIGISSPNCSPNCAYQYRKMKQRIYKRFDRVQQEFELEKLRLQGKNYVLPERNSE